MADLRETRRKLKIAIITMAAIDVVAVIILLSPLVGSGESRKQEMQQLQSELRQKTRQVEPLRGLDKKVVLASQEIDTFYRERLPDRESTISEELGKLASQSGVKIGQAKYDTKEAEEIGLTPFFIEATCQGDYLQLMRFINGLERDKTFFIVNSVVLGDAQGGSVKLQLKLETYLRSGS
jgi:type IV pilus assembly protein PilO